MTRTKKDMGRPRKYDLKQEAQDLLNWSLLPSSTSLYQFTDRKEYLAQELSGFADEDGDFALALKKAKERISERREGLCNAELMNYGVWARSADLYSSILHEHEETKKDNDSKRKQKEDGAKGPLVVNTIDYSKVKTE